MKSIKPGRGPSAMGGIGSVVAAIFGVFWTFMAASMGAPVPFVLFGVVFVIMGILQAVYQFHNATGKNRFSVYDITNENEEVDPIQEMLDQSHDSNNLDRTDNRHSDRRFCPYCGAEALSNYTYCEKCGKELP